jgi:L,D-transpeptidase YbiS
MKKYVLYYVLLLCSCVFTHSIAIALDVSDIAWLLNAQAQPDARAIVEHPRKISNNWVVVDVSMQQLHHFNADGVFQKTYVVSTAKNGLGEEVNSFKTPRGWHRVCEKIGDGVEANTIIHRRIITPWKYTSELNRQYPNKDWILTRILWLCGMELGKNLGGNVDSYDRAIYIHGSGGHVNFGTPTSRGCVRMTSDDVIELYADLPLGTDVFILEHLPSHFWKEGISFPQ